MFSKALFKQSCKANGLMWAIITVAVCFMLACVMLISGKSDIGEVKENIETTIIEETVKSNMKKATLNTYEIAISGVEYFDETFVDEFYVEVKKTENQATYMTTYTQAIEAGKTADEAKTEAFTKAFITPTYTYTAEALKTYAAAYATAAGAADNTKTITETMFLAVNPKDENGVGVANKKYESLQEVVPEDMISADLVEYLVEDTTAILAGGESSEAKEYLETGSRKYFRYERAENATAVAVADKTTNAEAVKATVASLSEYGVTEESYKEFGFTYAFVKDLSYKAALTYQGDLDYEVSKLSDKTDSNAIAQIKADLGVDIAGSFLDTLPQEVSDAIREIGAMDLYGLIVGSIFFKMAGLLLPIIYLIMVSNNLIVGQVDSGSMAYILSTSTKRNEVTFTQGVFLVGSLFAMFVCTAITSVVCFYIADVDTTLNVGKLLIINLGAFLVLFAMSGINFFTSCWFDRSKKSMAIGGGLSMFFLVATMLGLFGSEVLPSVIRISALNNFNYVSIISLFDVVNVIDGGYMWIWKLAILLAIGLVGYIVGSIKFKKKDLPL